MVSLIGWLIVNLDREMCKKRVDFLVEECYDRLRLLDGFHADNTRYSFEYCGVESQPLCSVEWLYLSIEEDLRETDEHIVTLMFAEGINVEINRELLSSAYLLVAMSVIVVFLLWINLRRISDVAIVSTSLVVSLIWMVG